MEVGEGHCIEQSMQHCHQWSWLVMGSFSPDSCIKRPEDDYDQAREMITWIRVLFSYRFVHRIANAKMACWWSTQVPNLRIVVLDSLPCTCSVSRYMKHNCTGADMKPIYGSWIGYMHSGEKQLQPFAGLNCSNRKTNKHHGKIMLPANLKMHSGGKSTNCNLLLLPAYLKMHNIFLELREIERMLPAPPLPWSCGSN